ncbi:MAG: hypothetical protein H7235_07225 [Bdellovibrionaceae bacterium]|nr:hypothetical protein [Pseudobdellovibrionaceae bacterium]
MLNSATFNTKKKDIETFIQSQVEMPFVEISHCLPYKTFSDITRDHDVHLISDLKDSIVFLQSFDRSSLRVFNFLAMIPYLATIVMCIYAVYSSHYFLLLAPVFLFIGTSVSTAQVGKALIISAMAAIASAAFENLTLSNLSGIIFIAVGFSSLARRYAGDRFAKYLISSDIIFTFYFIRRSFFLKKKQDCYVFDLKKEN